MRKLMIALIFSFAISSGMPLHIGEAQACNERVQDCE